MLFSCSGGAFIKLVSIIVLAFSVAANGIGNLLGTGNVIDTVPHSSYSVTANETASSDDIILEDEIVLNFRSTFRKFFNSVYNALGMKN